MTAISLSLAACASNPDIKTDYDHRIDFSQYQTYGFFNPLGIENPNYSSIQGSVFRDAISKEMERRGYKRSDNPDLMINVSGQRQNRTTITTNIDLVDRVRKQMVWEGVVTGRVKENKSRLDDRERIYTRIQEMFAAYPFRAGQ